MVQAFRLCGQGLVSCLGGSARAVAWMVQAVGLSQLLGWFRLCDRGLNQLLGWFRLCGQGSSQLLGWFSQGLVSCLDGSGCGSKSVAWMVQAV